MSPRILFEQELELLRQRVAGMGERAQNSYHRLAVSVEKDDRSVLEQLLDVDRQMQEMLRGIEAECLMLLTRQQPVARDLRLVSAALKAVTDIERVGDHVSDMAELFLRLPAGKILVKRKNLAEMLHEAGEMFRLAVEAFVAGDVETAGAVVGRDDVVDEYFNQIKEDMMAVIRSGEPDAEEMVDVLMIAKYLEKIGDHAVNICNWAIFQKTGNMENVRLL